MPKTILRPQVREYRVLGDEPFKDTLAWVLQHLPPKHRQLGTGGQGAALMKDGNRIVGLWTYALRGHVGIGEVLVLLPEDRYDTFEHLTKEQFEERYGHFDGSDEDNKCPYCGRNGWRGEGSDL